MAAIIKALRTSAQINYIEQAFGQSDCTTKAMRDAIVHWFDLYFQQDISKQEDPCQRLPYTIVNKIYKAAFGEYDSSLKDVGTDKLQFQDRNRKAFDAIKKSLMQWTLIGGEALIKPIPAGDHFRFCTIRRNCYAVLGRDETGEITAVGTAETTISGSAFYTLLEKRSLDSAGLLHIESKLFRSLNKDTLGTKVPLTALPKYAILQDEAVFPVPISGIGLIYIKTPMANAVDGSLDGVSVYDPAKTLIHDSYINERQFDQEFENGKSRLIASADLIKVDENGNRNIPDDMFTGIDDNAGQVGFTIFNPTLRDASYEARRQTYLRACEALIGLKHGILSNVQEVQRTATEITDSAGDYSLTIQDFQTMYYDALQAALRLCDTLGQLYGMCDATKWDPEALSVTWGNGILYDARQEWQDDMEMTAAGLLRPELVLAHKYDLPCDTPEQLQEIREKYMPEMTQLLKE